MSPLQPSKQSLVFIPDPRHRCISSVKVRMGYTKDYVRNEGFVEFFDDLARLQLINNADHLLAGCYSGMIDTKKINKADLNWLKEI